MKAKRRQKILKAILVKKLEKKDQERRLQRNQRIKIKRKGAKDSLILRLHHQMQMKKIKLGTCKTNTMIKKILKRKRISV